MASIPSREGVLERAVHSVYEQVDHIFIYLNNYQETPRFLIRPKISVFRSEDHGDIKDSGKFYGLTRVNRGIYFSLDDDIEYPPDYVRVLKSYLAKFGYKCVVGVHGIVLPTLAHSFFDRKVLHFERELSMTVPVSVLGTGTTAFSITATGIDFSIFQHHGMADLSLAVFLKRNGIPALALRRESGWLRSLCDRHEFTLYRNARQDSLDHTDLIVRHRPWGFDDLVERVTRTGLFEVLSGRWRALVAARAGAADATERLSNYPLAMMHDVARTLMNPCEVWKIARAFRPTRKQDPQLHSQLLQESIAYYPEEVVDTARMLYKTARENRHHHAIVEYGGAYMASLAKLDLHEDADELYGRLMESEAVSPTAAMEYLRLKSRQRDHRAALSVIENHYDALRDFPDFPAHFFDALAEFEGVKTAIHILLPSFMRDGRQAARLRRTALSVLSRHGVKPPTHRRTYSLMIAETTALKHNRASRIHDLALLYFLVGDRASAKRLLTRGRNALRAELGCAMYALLRTLTAATPHSTIRWLNAYNSACGLSRLRLCGDTTSSQPFLRSLESEASVPASSSMGLVSVVMAVFNSQETVEYAARSILNQSYPQIELIIVDDASTDGTADVLDRLRRTDPRVTVVRNQHNVGPYACRNIALQVCRGDFLAIQDADDFAHPERIARQILKFENEQIIASYAKHIRIERNGGLTLENNGAVLGDGPVTLLCRRKVFQEIGPFASIRTRGDIEFRDRLKCFYGVHRIAHLPEILVYALHDQRSNSHSMLATAEARRELTQFRAAYNRELVLAQRIEDIAAKACSVTPGSQPTPSTVQDTLPSRPALEGIER